MIEFIRNPNPITNWKPGDTCYFYERWAGKIATATIESVQDSEWVRIRGVSFRCGLERPMNRLFRTKEAAEKSFCGTQRRIIDELKSEIATVDDLVRFGYTRLYWHLTHNNQDIPDVEAQLAYKERAKELLGLELT